MVKTVFLRHVLWAECGVAFVVVDECVVGLLRARSVKLFITFWVGTSNVGARLSAKFTFQFGGTAAFGHDLIAMKAELLDASVSLADADIVFVVFVIHFEEARTRQKTEQMTRQIFVSSICVLTRVQSRSDDSYVKPLV